MSRRFRLLLFAVGLLALLLLAMSSAVLWSQRGPGLRHEADRLASIMGLRPGMTCAEIGAGYGRMAVLIAQHLGKSGHLYATEIETDKLQAIRREAAAAGLNTVTAVEADERSSGLPDDCCDAIFMRRVYHHLTDAASINRALYAAVRPGGRLVIIDFLSPRWMFLRHGISSGLLIEQVTAAGFTVEGRVDRWSPIDFCIVFRKPRIMGTGYSTPEIHRQTAPTLKSGIE